MSEGKTLLDKQNGNFQNISESFNNIYIKIKDILLKNVKFPIFILVIGILFMFLGPCLLGPRLNFTNELEEVTQEPLEPENEEKDLIKEPKFEKTYENTTLSNTPSSEFEVLKNFKINETNNIISVKEKINDYSYQPTFSPGQFN
jgi:hypothetical protein|tara:strand:+ start:41 stop:475 length:435 start_codon:yes stop_codon:yes gene_type:complete